MKKITDIELTGLQKSVLWIVALSGILIKVVFDSFFLLLEQYDSFAAISIRLLISLLTFFSLLIIFFAGFNTTLTINETGFDSYISDLLKLLSFSLILFIISFFLPNSIIGGSSPDSFIEIIFINLYSISSLILALGIFKFFFKWVWHRRFKFTKFHFKIIIGLSIVIILFIDLPNHFKHIEPEEIISNSFLMTISLILNISLALVVFLASSKSQWLAALPILDKWKLLGSSFLLSVFSILFIVKDLSNVGDGELSNALASIFPASSVFGIAILLLLVYSTRIFFAALLSLPTSSIIARKSGEFNSLTYLSKMISRAVDFDNLIEMVSSLSLDSSGGSIVWTDTKDESGQFRIRTIKSSGNSNKSNEELKSLLNDQFYLQSFDFISSLTDPIYIESIPDAQTLPIKSFERILNSKSVIIMPLKAVDKRVGTLYLLHANEYGFDSDFLTLLGAFNDNLTIAIENTRLLEESIEKEKYKKELNIAREMEQKLLPAYLPSNDNYSLSGYSISADEVGGDYYDIVDLEDGNKCLLIADVSGKGMSAAFYMVLLKGVVLSLSGQVSSVSELLKGINRILYPELERKMFITMAALKINDLNGNISLARAGHMPFLLKRSDEVFELRPNGIGLGLVQPERFDPILQEIDIKLNEDDALLMYSDGIVEMFKEGEDLDSGFLKQLLTNSVHKDSEGLINEIKCTVKSMKEEYTIIDDMTLVCISFRGRKKGEEEND